MPVFILFVVLLVIVCIYLISTYNSLIGLRNQVRNSWSQIDIQLKRRHDLIPNLLETVKGYMHHERETLEAVVKARSMAMNAASVADKASCENALTGALSKLNLVVENYPALKADQGFLGLQEELSSTENKISFSRQNYNDQVLFFNNKIEMFPSNIIASMYNFTKEMFFKVDDVKEREVPKVSFS